MTVERARFVCLSAVLLLYTTACGDRAVDRAHDEHEEQGAHDEQDEHAEHEDGIVALSVEAATRAGIRTAPAALRILEGRIATTGEVDFDHTRLAHVSPRISGRVHRVDATLGQSVRTGQKLAEIDSIELGRAKAEFLQAKAKEELARKSHQRAQSLLADRIASQQEVLEAEAALRDAAAVLGTAEETLHLYGLSQTQVDALHYDDSAASIHSLRAPFSGTIVERHATLGELVTPERNLFTLADLSRVWIWVDVYQRDLGRVHLEDQVEVRVDAFPDRVFGGTVSYLSARVATETRTIRARLDVANPAGELRPGMFVQVALFDPHEAQGSETRSASLVVPRAALVRDAGETAVFVAAGERRYQRRAVRTGREVGDYVEILDGLAAGEPVVVEGAFLLKSAAAKDTLGGGHEH